MAVNTRGINIVDSQIGGEKAFKYASKGCTDVTVDTYLTKAHWGKTLLCYNTITIYFPDTLPVGFWCVIRNKDTNVKTIAVFGSRALQSDGNLLETENTSCFVEVEPADYNNLNPKVHAEGRLTS